jgi:maleate cis-trans isomerase
MDRDASYRSRSWPKPRARIGLIIPSVNSLTEPQFNRYAPEGVTFHIHRTCTDPDLKLLDAMPEILQAGAMLKDAQCDLIVYHCTGKSMGSGTSAEQELVDMLEQKTGRPTATTATAIAAAMRAVKARKVVLVTPYPQRTNDREKVFLSQLGVEVVGDRALDLPVPDGMCGMTPDVWIEVTLEASRPEADAYFLSCTNIQSLETIETIERKLQRPVITSNQAGLWFYLRRCGLSDKVLGLGRLLGLPLERTEPATARAS